MIAADPRLVCVLWYRQHQRALAHVRRTSAAYERAWRSGQSAMREWERLQAAHHRAAVVFAMLRAARGW